MSPDFSHAPPWGSQQLFLTLPGLDLQVDGLSEQQAQQLRTDYMRFCAAPSHTTHWGRLLARQLPDFTAPADELLTRDGQYTPRKHYPDEGPVFELTGHDFHALLHTPAAGAESFLGVRDAAALPRGTVFENVLRVLCAHSALATGGAILHSAGIVHAGAAYIFCGRSNAGKTTLTRKAHAAGFEILSDDINLLLPDGDSYAAHAVPFTGEFGRSLKATPTQDRYPVAALVLLEQGEPLATTPVSAAAAASTLLVGCPFVNTDERVTGQLLDNVTRLSANLPVLRLRNALGDDIGAIMDAVNQLDRAT